MIEGWSNLDKDETSFPYADICSEAVSDNKVFDKFKKGDIIFWKGHVAICLNSKKLIHAYGPEKKVLMMPIIKTINRIRETANLEVKKIARIKF